MGGRVLFDLYGCETIQETLRSIGRSFQRRSHASVVVLAGLHDVCGESESSYFFRGTIPSVRESGSADGQAILHPRRDLSFHRWLFLNDLWQFCGVDTIEISAPCRAPHESDIWLVARRCGYPAGIEGDQNELTGISTVRAAAHSEAAAISSLAMRSKAHWGYSDEFMQACREELTYSRSQIESEHCEFFVIEAECRIIGFYALKFTGPVDAELDALFVEPEMIGRGIGRTLIEHAKARASRLGIRQIIIQGDPNAESFYEAAGGIRDGRRESGSIPGRLLPLFRIDL